MADEKTLNEIMLRYIDDELSPAERQEIEKHLEQDAAYQHALVAVQQQVLFANSAMAHLAPIDQPNAQRALNRMHAREVQEKRNRMNTRTRRIAAVAAVAIVLAGSLALAPVRALASDLLAVFRVERFVVVNVDQARFEELQAAFEELDTEELVFGDKETIRDGGEPVEVGSVDEAAGQVSFALRSPEGYGDPTSIAVQAGSQSVITPNVEAMRQLYSAVGLDPEILPEEIDGQRFEIITETGVVMGYENEDTPFMLMQAGAPTTVVPDGVDTDELAVAVLQLLGMSQAEAEIMAANIDFSTTLLLPIPTSEVERVREISVDGTTGIMFEGDWDDEERGQSAMLMWQKNGVVYVLGTDSASTATLVDVAASLN